MSRALMIARLVGDAVRLELGMASLYVEGLRARRRRVDAAPLVAILPGRPQPGRPARIRILRVLLRPRAPSLITRSAGVDSIRPLLNVADGLISAMRRSRRRIPQRSSAIRPTSARPVRARLPGPPRQVTGSAPLV